MRLAEVISPKIKMVNMDFILKAVGSHCRVEAGEPVVQTFTGEKLL